MSNTDTVSAHGAEFSFGVTVAFTLNYIIGTGFLTLPWGFHETGAALGIFLLGTLTLFAISASYSILETIARAEAYANQSNNFGSIIGDISVESVVLKIRNDSECYLPLAATRPSSKNASRRTSANETLTQNGQNGVAYDNNIDNENQLLQISDRKFEVIELCKIFLGKVGARIYTFIITIYLYCALWGYSTVFANSLGARLPLINKSPNDTKVDEYSFNIYLLVFAVIVIPASMLDLNEQVFIQVTLSVFRILMLVVMISTIIFASIYGAEDGITATNDSQIFGPLTPTPETKNSFSLFTTHFNKVYLLLPMAAYATIFHHAIPDLSQPVRNKLELGRIYAVSLLVCFIGYSFLAITVSKYFGNMTLVSSNLNWEYFWGILGSNREIPLYARFISSFVVLLPALDVASAFPLNAITMGNNLMAAYHGSRIHTLGTSEFYRQLMLFRLISAIPPLLSAFLISNLGVITHLAGLAGFAIAFLVPALLSKYSKKVLKVYNLEYQTHYSCWLTSDLMCNINLGVGSFLIIYVTTSFLVMGSA